jgi:hypothetical protein
MKPPIDNHIALAAGEKLIVAKMPLCECCGEECMHRLSTLDVISRIDADDDTIDPAELKVCETCYDELMRNEQINFLRV